MALSKHPLAASNTPSPLSRGLIFYEKHPLQNTENYCHQSLSDGFRVHQIRLPDPIWVKRALVLRGEEYKEKSEGKVKEGRGG